MFTANFKYNTSICRLGSQALCSLLQRDCGGVVPPSGQPAPPLVFRSGAAGSRSLAQNVRSLVQVCAANLLYLAYREADQWPLLFLKVLSSPIV